MLSDELKGVAAELRDAKRYAGDWEVARTEIPRIKDLVEKVRLAAYRRSSQHIPAPRREIFDRVENICRRVVANVSAGLPLVITSPDVLRGYLSYGAVELESVAEQVLNIEEV